MAMIRIAKIKNQKSKIKNGFTLISAGRLATLPSSQWRSSDIKVQPLRGFTLKSALLSQSDIRRKAGFTLIELLIVLVVLSILGLVAANLLSSVLKGTNKAQVISEVKQNGQFLSDTLERHIHQAQDASVSGSILTLTTAAGSETIAFVVPCSTCNPPTNGKITLNGASITNTDPATGVDVSLASFTLLPTLEGSPKVIQVEVTLNQGIATPTRKDFEANIRLSNTYSLRTY